MGVRESASSKVLGVRYERQNNRCQRDGKLYCG